jgi:hypothetical protein
MNQILKVERNIQGLDIDDVICNPSAYEPEIVLAVIDSANDISRQAREVKMRLEADIISRMKKEDATKWMFIDVNGQERKATLKKGPVKCEMKEADENYKMFGFDPIEIGEYVFKPSWQKAKEARKFGGEKQKVIDGMFVEGKESIYID